MSDTTIINIRPLEILDSRGNPTIKTQLSLQSGTAGIASIPSGAVTIIGTSTPCDLNATRRSFPLSFGRLRLAMIRSGSKFKDCWIADPKSATVTTEYPNGPKTSLDRRSRM